MEILHLDGIAADRFRDIGLPGAGPRALQHTEALRVRSHDRGAHRPNGSADLRGRHRPIAEISHDVGGAD